jgi:ATP-dependent DNA ligase
LAQPFELLWGTVLLQAPLPMLVQLDSQLPEGPHWRYEPKLDGFRGLLWRRSGSQVQLLSRNSRGLGPWFPELIRAAPSLPPNTLVDGEIVICDESGWVDSGALQERLSTARNTVGDVAQRRPAVLVVFDVLERDGADLALQPLSTRRGELTRLLVVVFLGGGVGEPFCGFGGQG